MKKVVGSKLIKFSKVSNILGCSRSQLYNLRSEGLLPPIITFGGRSVYIDEFQLYDLVDFSAKSESAPTKDEIRAYIAENFKK